MAITWSLWVRADSTLPVNDGGVEWSVETDIESASLKNRLPQILQTQVTPAISFTQIRDRGQNMIMWGPDFRDVTRRLWSGMNEICQGPSGTNLRMWWPKNAVTHLLPSPLIDILDDMSELTIIIDNEDDAIGQQPNRDPAVEHYISPTWIEARMSNCPEDRNTSRQNPSPEFGHITLDIIPLFVKITSRFGPAFTMTLG